MVPHFICRELALIVGIRKVKSTACVFVAQAGCPHLLKMEVKVSLRSRFKKAKTFTITVLLASIKCG
jgi:hypothetical protein